MPPIPFGFTTTAADVLAEVDLAGKRAVITGATSGIGVETARALAAAGAEVVLAVRRIDAGNQTAAQISVATGNPAVTAARLDVADLSSVRDFVSAFDGRPVHMLINNAGVMALPELSRTREGREMQFATNYLGHFALTLGLQPALAAAGGARVVSVSSSGHLLSPVVFDDIDFRFRLYDPLAAYGQSKTAAALLAVGVTDRWRDDGIVANALNPGAIATGLQKHTGGLSTPVERRKTIEQGAATSVLLAASPVADGIGGRYFEDCNESPVVTERPDDFTGVAPYALDHGNADRLWDSQRSFSP
ncbi:SDR family NAD(P)-dependent oxidoreductase [Mycolicibacterium vaccae]|uniref:Probable oxidoreductase n=1 Tax=Mycolicibacterium vaccae ATCC 25954 TaxID=1194972 RepID=K0V7F1_MYCVA|nr:SDR family NAD(P)-dependent oxidoreductase [Mycolicibacterium vaccae]EJZ10768.1 short-chain dehydrogenase/reductase SDR [Mycolicibacterium vaccae ATCC 25954]MCV7064031.1 SDR family NAD(P)-dependent oxidoreductase [Mycolicibacterium vaccae]